MAVAGAHLSVITLTLQQTNVNADLMRITEKRNRLTDQESALMGTKDWYSNEDSKVKLLLLQQEDNALDMQQKKLETVAKAISSNLESQQKLLDNNIKKDFGYSLFL
ncbi:MAG: hypothetical protein PHV37_01395 [Candidatus Gastranaerophilales bacterium]|nr:hypothetical protein [Candidatus Gastranaerophilales bacterium]